MDRRSVREWLNNEHIHPLFYEYMENIFKADERNDPGAVNDFYAVADGILAGLSGKDLTIFSQTNEQEHSRYRHFYQWGRYYGSNQVHPGQRFHYSPALTLDGEKEIFPHGTGKIPPILKELWQNPWSVAYWNKKWKAVLIGYCLGMQKEEEEDLSMTMDLLNHYQMWKEEYPEQKLEEYLQAGEQLAQERKKHLSTELLYEVKYNRQDHIPELFLQMIEQDRMDLLKIVLEYDRLSYDRLTYDKNHRLIRQASRKLFSGSYEIAELNQMLPASLEEIPPGRDRSNDQIPWFIRKAIMDKPAAFFDFARGYRYRINNRLASLPIDYMRNNRQTLFKEGFNCAGHKYPSFAPFLKIKKRIYEDFFSNYLGEMFKEKNTYALWALAEGFVSQMSGRTPNTYQVAQDLNDLLFLQAYEVGQRLAGFEDGRAPKHIDPQLLAKKSVGSVMPRFSEDFPFVGFLNPSFHSISLFLIGYLEIVGEGAKARRNLDSFNRWEIANIINRFAKRIKSFERGLDYHHFCLRDGKAFAKRCKQYRYYRYEKPNEKFKMEFLPLLEEIIEQGRSDLLDVFMDGATRDKESKWDKKQWDGLFGSFMQGENGNQQSNELEQMIQKIWLAGKYYFHQEKCPRDFLSIKLHNFHKQLKEIPLSKGEQLPLSKSEKLPIRFSRSKSRKEKLRVIELFQEGYELYQTNQSFVLNHHSIEDDKLVAEGAFFARESDEKWLSIRKQEQQREKSGERSRNRSRGQRRRKRPPAPKSFEGESPVIKPNVRDAKNQKGLETTSAQL